MRRIICNENDSAKRSWIRQRFREKHNRAARLSHQAARDIPQKWMQHHFLLQRASNYHVDLLTHERTQNSVTGISFFIVNRGIARKPDLRERIVKLLCDFVSLLARKHQMKIGGKALPDSLRFGKNLLEARREGSRHGNGFVWRRVAHQSKCQLRLSPAFGNQQRKAAGGL